MRKILVVLCAVAVVAIIVLAMSRTHFLEASSKPAKPVLLKTFGHPSRIEKSPKGDFCTLYFSSPRGAGTQLWGVPKGGGKKLSALRLGQFKLGKLDYYQAFLPKAETKKAETGGAK